MQTSRIVPASTRMIRTLGAQTVDADTHLAFCRALIMTYTAGWVLFINPSFSPRSPWRTRGFPWRTRGFSCFIGNCAKLAARDPFDCVCRCHSERTFVTEGHERESKIFHRDPERHFVPFDPRYTRISTSSGWHGGKSAAGGISGRLRSGWQRGVWFTTLSCRRKLRKMTLQWNTKGMQPFSTLYVEEFVPFSFLEKFFCFL